MASRAVWKGYLKLSLVSVPVKAYTASDSTAGDIHLNQLHDQCHSRIRYVKTCPVHGEVPASEIVSGYQIGKDQYVIVDPDEVSALRPQNDHSIEIDTFITSEELDDRFLTERSYYLVPDGKVAQKPYALISKTLTDTHCRAIAEVVMSQREQHVIIRPIGKLLLMTVLQHANQLKSPAEFESDVDATALAEQELALTRQLVEALTKDDWDFTSYSDHYREKLAELVAAKVEGKELVKPPEVEAPTIINLMDALKASINQIPVPGTASHGARTKSSTKRSGSISTSKSHGKKTESAQATATTAAAAKATHSKAAESAKVTAAEKPARKAASSTARTTSKRKTNKRKTG